MACYLTAVKINVADYLTPNASEMSMTLRKSYHHGDLRNALLDAGEAELMQNGLAGFSLRKVAARVGVSHSAPSHHFGDVAGLVEALAVRGFERLLNAMELHQAKAPDDAFERLVATGQGYVDFAMRNPALFRLVFGQSMRPDASAALQQAAAAAYVHLATAVGGVHGTEAFGHPRAREDVLAYWSRAHGFAELVLAGYVSLPDPADPEQGTALFRDVFATQVNP